VPVVFDHYWRHAQVATIKAGPELFDAIDSATWHGPRGNVFCVDFSVGARFLERQGRGVPGRVTKFAALRWPERTLTFDTDEVHAVPTSTSSLMARHAAHGLQTSSSGLLVQPRLAARSH
jgi:hypothetical protein